MKKYIVLLIAVLALINSGCDDSFLEEKTNPNKLTPESFWKKEGDIEKGLTSVYANLQPSMSWAATVSQYIVAENFRTDELDWRDDVTSWIQIASFVNESDNTVSRDYWKYQYSGIFKANQCIERIPTVPGISKELENSTASEARFLRAYFYYKLYLNFGERIPLVVKAFGDSNDYFYPPQAAAGEIYQFIISELSAVQQYLPSSYSASYGGRGTKWAAAAILGKLYMFKGEFQKASVEFKKIIDSGQFELLPNYGFNFDGNHKNNKESIFELQFSGDRSGGRKEYNQIAVHFASFNAPDGGYEEAYPSKWLFNLLKKDTTVSGAYGDRLLETIMFDDPNSSSFYYGKGKFTSFHRSDEIFWKKFVTWSPGQSEAWYYSAFNIPLVRYADILLLYAEAINETEGAKPIVFSCINQVRTRSHVAPIPTTWTQAQVREHIRNTERPCELALESSRWYDLKRWGIIKETLIGHQKRAAANFIPGKHDLFPIPITEMLLNRDWEQNPGFGK